MRCRQGVGHAGRRGAAVGGHVERLGHRGLASGGDSGAVGGSTGRRGRGGRSAGRTVDAGAVRGGTGVSNRRSPPGGPGRRAPVTQDGEAAELAHGHGDQVRPQQALHGPFIIARRRLPGPARPARSPSGGIDPGRPRRGGTNVSRLRSSRAAPTTSVAPMPRPGAPTCSAWRPDAASSSGAAGRTAPALQARRRRRPGAPARPRPAAAALWSTPTGCPR